MIEPIIASPEVVKYVTKRFGIHMSKKLGQNFLIDRSIVDGIVHAAKLDSETAVLEVGPGIGTLTQGLAQSGAKVTAVELDKRLLEVLSHTLAPYKNVRVIHGDVLALNINEVMEGKPFKVVANLPYYITTPIIMGLLENKLPLTQMVVMVQKEVADRMVATPGSKIYGALSVAVQYYTTPEIVLDVPPHSFLPAPAVDSAVVSCVVRKEPPVQLHSEELFFKTIKGAFAQRRKTLANTLQTTGLAKDVIYQILEESGIEPNRRGETLSMEEFATISNKWFEWQQGEK